MAPSVARTLQGRSDRRDNSLTDLARQRTPGIRHWWGRRWREGRNGAWCYICERFVITWDSHYPITEGARRVIAAHRSGHIAADLRGSRTGKEHSR